MAELTIDAADIAAVTAQERRGLPARRSSSEQVGRVLEVGDGIARVAGPARTPRSTSCSSSKAARSASR